MKKLLTLFTLLLCVCSGAWAEEPTHANPALVTVANRTFLDLSKTPSNVTVNATDLYSNYGPGYFIAHKDDDLSDSWWNFTGTFKSSSSSYSNVSGAVGFHTPGSSGEFYAKLQMRTGSGYMTQMDFYVTGTTSIGFQWKNGGTSNKYITFTIYEMDVTGETASDKANPTTVDGTTTSKNDQYDVSGTLDGSKYYHIVATPLGESNINIYGITFKHDLTPTAPTFSPESGEVEQGKTVSVTSSYADNIYYAWSATESEPATPASWSYVACTDNVGEVPVPDDVTGTYYLYAYGKNDVSGTIAYATYTIVEPKTPTSLAFNEPTTSVAEGSKVTNVATLTPAIDGAIITFSSDDKSIATVDENTGEVTGVAAGSTTIRANYGGNSTYSSSTANYTITVLQTWTRHDNHTLPTSVLNLSDAASASTTLGINWQKDRPYFGNDGADNYVVVAPYCVYSQNGENLTWSLPTSANSSTSTWSSTDVFKGSSYYTQESNKARYATVRQDKSGNYYRYRVTGVTKVKLLCNPKGVNLTLGAFLVTDGTPANNTLLFVRNNTNTTNVLTIDALDPAKEYLVTIDNSYSNTTDTQSQIYELAFFYDDAIEVFQPVTVSALGYATFAPNLDVDFTGTSIEAYKATVDGTTVDFTKVNVVPAKTGVLLYADEGASVNVPVATTAADDFTGNKLVRGTGASLTYEENVTEYYILANETAGIGFYKANGNVVATNKAYLDLTNTGGAKSFVLPGGETDGIRSIENSELRIENSDYYNLAGQRVGKDYKGIVIVNGKKMLNK